MEPQIHLYGSIFMGTKAVAAGHTVQCSMVTMEQRMTKKPAYDPVESSLLMAEQYSTYEKYHCSTVQVLDGRPVQVHKNKILLYAYSTCTPEYSVQVQVQYMNSACFEQSLS